jgi:hypothetical protein
MVMIQGILATRLLDEHTRRRLKKPETESSLDRKPGRVFHSPGMIALGKVAHAASYENARVLAKHFVPFAQLHSRQQSARRRPGSSITIRYLTRSQPAFGLRHQTIPFQQAEIAVFQFFVSQNPTDGDQCGGGNATWQCVAFSN